MSDHGGMLTIQYHTRVVVYLFGLSKHEVQLHHTTLKQALEKPGNQSSSYCVFLESIVEVESECDGGIVVKELRGKCIPPQVVYLLTPLLKSLVHLKDPEVGLSEEGNSVYFSVHEMHDGLLHGHPSKAVVVDGVWEGREGWSDGEGGCGVEGRGLEVLCHRRAATSEHRIQRYRMFNRRI